MKPIIKLFIYRVHLSIRFSVADLKIKYEGGLLSLVWYILNPFMTFLLINGVFSQNLGKEISYYSLYLMSGIAFFNFFQQATIEATKILYENRFLIKSINFPLETLAFSPIIKAFISHGIEFFILLIIFTFSGLPMLHIIFYPLILLLYAAFTTGIVFLLASLGVYFVDLANMWLFMVRILWIITPVFYELGENHKTAEYINSLNPLHYFLILLREVIFFGSLKTTGIIIPIIITTIFFLIIGASFFVRTQKNLAEKM